MLISLPIPSQMTWNREMVILIVIWSILDRHPNGNVMTEELGK